MKTNITIVGLAKEYTKKVAKEFADKLDMYYADITDLIQFDLIDVEKAEKTCGKEYIRNLEATKIKTVSSYDNSVITVNFHALNSEKNLKYIKENTLLIYLRLDKDNLKKKLNLDINKDAQAKLAESVFDDRDFILSRICDVIINVKDLSDNKVVKLIGKSILDYYKG